MDNLERARILISFLGQLRDLHDYGVDTGDKITKVADELVSILIPHKDACPNCGSNDIEYAEVQSGEQQEVIINCNDCVIKCTKKVDVEEIARELDRMMKRDVKSGKPPHFFIH